MRRCVLTSCLVLAGVLTTLPLTAEETTKGWHHDYADAYYEAKRFGKPLVVHFYTDWCGPCRQMEASVLNTAEVKAKLGRSVVGVKLNADHYSSLAGQFGVGSFPTDVFVGPDGKILSRRSGFTSRQGYVSQIAQAGEQVAIRSLAASEPSEAELDAEPALGGFSPVAITRLKQWQKGSREFAWEHAGVVYHLQDADELALFRADPQRYVPELSGQDPLELSSSGRSVPGDIRYGAFFRGKLYLLTNDENRKRFVGDPRRIADSAARLQTEVSRSLEM